MPNKTLQRIIDSGKTGLLFECFLLQRGKGRVCHMVNLIKSHEDFMRQSLEDSAADLDWLLHYHKTWIGFLQHERLVHLLVTLMVIILFLLFFGLCLFFKTAPYLALFLIITILLIFYLLHYYKLENSVQRWYSLYDSIAIKKFKQHQV